MLGIKLSDIIHVRSKLSPVKSEVLSQLLWFLRDDYLVKIFNVELSESNMVFWIIFESQLSDLNDKFIDRDIYLHPLWYHVSQGANGILLAYLDQSVVWKDP